MSTGFVWASYILTYALVGGYALWVAARLRRHRRS